jgi:carboxymethylenebutenolidase
LFKLKYLGDRLMTEAISTAHVLREDQRAELDSLVPPITFSRRGFMASSIAGGFAASVVPTGPLLAQVISTDSVGLEAGPVSFMSDGVQIPAYCARPQGKSNCPTVLVIQEIFGVHEYIQDTCRRLAKQGFLALAPEMYVRQGDPRKYTAMADLFANVVSKVPDAQVMKDLDNAAAWAVANGGNASKLGITGFCWGGRVVWMYAAHNKNIKAGVAWYGRLTGQPNALSPTNPYDIAEQLHGPVLGLYGAADTGIPVSTVDEMRTRLSFGNAASRASDFVLYPDTPHAFHADYRPSYRAGPAQDGFNRLLAWFKLHGVS